ncbi:MAG: YfiR family protein [Rhodospirillales bacterium]
MAAGRPLRRHPRAVHGAHRERPCDGDPGLAKGQPILSVSESEEAFNLGSAINFIIVDDNVRFDVAVRQAELRNLKISSRLLAVARKVISSPS